MYIPMYFCSLFCLYSLIFKHSIFLLYLFSFLKTYNVPVMYYHEILLQCALYYVLCTM